MTDVSAAAQRLLGRFGVKLLVDFVRLA